MNFEPAIYSWRLNNNAPLAPMDSRHPPTPDQLTRRFTLPEPKPEPAREDPRVAALEREVQELRRENLEMRAFIAAKERLVQDPTKKA